jgi:hypothetical protein
MGDPPSKADRRVLHHVLQAEFCAALVMLTHVSLATKDAQWWATTLQFVGAVVTFAGLFWAYFRARYGLGLWELLDRGYARVERWVRRLLGKGRPIVVRVPMGALKMGGFPPTVRQVFRQLDRTLPIEGQLAQLESAITNLQEWFDPIRDDLHALRTEIQAVRVLTESSAQKALAEIEKRIAEPQPERARRPPSGAGAYAGGRTACRASPAPWPRSG